MSRPSLPCALACCLLLLALPLLCTGCVEPAGPEAFEQVQTLGSRTATLSIEPYPPVTMRRAELRLALRDAQGRPVPGARVRFDLDMPDCAEMPINRPQAAEQEPGLYATPALFTMAGYWQARAEVTGIGEDQVFTFYLRVK